MTDPHADSVSVVALPHFVPEAARVTMDVAAGTSLADIVAGALPGASEHDLDQMRLVIASPAGEMVIERAIWHRVRPLAGTTVVIRVVPAGQQLRTILSLVVTVAALALGHFLGGPLATALAGTIEISAAQGAALISAGTLLIGSLAINALVPVQTPPEQRAPKANYQITGWRNTITPDGVVPMVHGKVRYAPPFAMAPYSEVIDDRLYINACFCYGYGPLELSGHRIGETPVGDFFGVKQINRLGYGGTNEMNMFPDTVIEHADAGGIELVRPLPRNNRGEVIEGPSIATPVLRTLAPDAKRARIIFSFPSGLIRIKDNGDERPLEVDIRIRQRPVGDSVWAYDETITISGMTRDPFYRQHEWRLLPARGLHEVQITRMTDERIDMQKIDRVVLVALQSIRPEYGINFDPRLCLVGIRIRSSDQLNGMLDSYSAVASRVCRDWDHESGTWIVRETRNPAAIFRDILQGPANARPVGDGQIDLDALADWHDFCRVKALRYDRVHDFESSLEEALAVVAAAGRAVPRHDGRKWTVVIDRPQGQVIDMISARNSEGMSQDVVYIDPPHALRIPFLDRTNDFMASERLVRRPGYSGEITLTEQLDLPGKTEPREVFVEGIRRWYELLYRRVTVTLMQDGLARVATRGDLVMVNHDLLRRTQKSARVTRVQGSQIVLDDIVTMEEGESYGIRFKKISEGNVIGATLTRTVQTVAGERQSLQLLNPGTMPTEGHLIHFGPVAHINCEMIVSSIEPAEDNRCRLTLIATSDLIDEYTNATVVPDWSPRVGSELSDAPIEPGIPTIDRVLHGLAGTDSEDGLEVKVIPDRDGDVKTVKIELDHKLALSGSWSTKVIKDGERWAVLAGYAKGDAVQLRPRGISGDGVPGPYGTIVDVTIGSEDDDIPADLDPEAISVVGGMGCVVINGATTDDLPTAWIQLYRNQTGVLDRDNDRLGDPLPVKRRIAFSYTDGDPSRVQLLKRGQFGSSNPWWWTGGWNVANGVATKSPGVAGDLNQWLDVVAGKYYRVMFVVSGRTAGAVRPRLIGGGGVNGTWRDGNGTFYDRMLNGSGNDRFTLAADADFDGRIEEVYLYRESQACLDQGTWTYWLEPVNAQIVPGNVAGPFETIVI